MLCSSMAICYFRASPDTIFIEYSKDQLALKIVLPEKLCSLTVDPSGDFCAGGTSQGRIYLWEACTIILVSMNP